MLDKFAKFGGIGTALVGGGMNIVADQIPDWVGWIMICIGTTIAIYGFIHSKIEKLKPKKEKPSLEIIFDPTNPSQRYWKFTNEIDQKTGKPFPIHLYRVLLKNVSDKTLENVRATVETTGTHGMPPQLAQFQINDETEFTLHPNEEKFIDVIKWPHPINKDGSPFGKTAKEMYGDLKISVNAKNMRQSCKIFGFDYEREPMIFDKAVVSENSKEIGRVIPDWPIDDAAQYLANMISSDRGKDEELLAIRVIQNIVQAAFNGDIVVFGESGALDNHASYKPMPKVDIPKDFWRGHTLDTLPMILNGKKTFHVVYGVYESGAWLYTELHVNKSQIMTLWPNKEALNVYR